MTPHDQMIHTPDGKTVVVKVGDDRNLQSNIKPEFSFDYDSLNFSTSTKERVHGGETIALTDSSALRLKRIYRQSKRTPLLPQRYSGSTSARIICERLTGM